jgi:cytochrome c biogenesis factor
MQETLSRLLLLPVNIIVMVILVPIILISQVVCAIGDLVGLASIIKSGDFFNALEFIRADKSDVKRRLILSEKFPNSIAVRS